MKSLSLSRPLVIMMLGLPGSGKSYFASQFTDIFQAPLASVDRVRSTAYPQPSWSREEELVVATLINDQVEQLLKTGKTFLIDGAMSSRTARSAIEFKARRYNYETLVVWMQVDTPTAHYRAIHRNPKKVADQFNPPLTPELFARAERQLTAPLPEREHVVVISGKHAFSAQAKVVLKKLVDHHSDHTPPIERLTTDKQAPPRPATATSRQRANTTSSRSITIN